MSTMNPAQAIQELRNNQGDLQDLETVDKSTLVAAINEAAQSGGGGGGSTPLGSWQMTLADGSPFTVTLTDSGEQTLVQSYTQLEMNDMLSTLTALDNLVGVSE